MQGSYQSNGLPRPYNMKPMRTKKGSPYDNVSRNFFSSPRRKLLGYVVMLTLFCVGVYWLGQSLRPQPDTDYEIVTSKPPAKIDVDKNIDHIVDKSGADEDNIVLAGNMAKNSKGDVGIGVMEAPKGGIANEAPVVGNDERKVIDGKKTSKLPAAGKKIDIKDEVDPDEEYV